ncbi:ATP-binding protein [Aquicoccus sp. SU-CL01552]|uniref:PAS domain-containing hybrid sensor histidine kinase/response regulator n=1 Tax=Aquicoccus sp. SU-CL01552 TaxID=3127656 RepID=UPI00310506A9
MQFGGAAEADPLVEFRHRNSKEGLLLRYAHGRVKNFGSRQIMTVAGGLFLWMMNGPLAGLSALSIALIGESVDCLYLRSAETRLKEGEALERVYGISTLTATIQALAVSVCIALSWFGETTSASPLFAIAFLAGAAINGGLVLPYHRAAGTVRLVIYVTLAGLLFVLTGIMHGAPDTVFSMNAAGTLMLGFMVFSFLDYAVSGFHQHQASTRAVIEKSAELKAVNIELAARQKEAQRLSLVARNAHDSVLLLNRDGRIAWVNETFTRITGYLPQEAVGRFPGDLLNGPETDQRVVAALNDALARGVPFRGEIQNRSKSGETIWIETNQVPVIDAAGEVDVIVAIERDITATKHHQREMSLARQAAEEGARAKSEFLATMSHEIRTPMNGVIGMADLLVESGLNADQRVYAETIRSSAQALLTIINDVLDLSRLDARRMTLDPVDFDLKTCVQEPVRLLRPQARKKGLSLRLDFAGEGGDRLHGDDSRLRQVLINLIGNAIKFTSTGGIAVRVCRAPTGDGMTSLRIEVEDTGIGIPKDKQEHIFERFAQADASTTREYGGTGLGLTISRMLVEEMGGTIAVRSEPGCGACFEIALCLPAAESTGDDRARDASPPDAAGQTLLAGKRILVAEDAEVNRILIGKYLGGIDLRLDFAHDGLEAVEKTLESRPDIVLMDMSMPGISGLEATRRIRAAAVAQPVIVALTANAFDSDREACLEAGMDGFLTKPVRRAELLAGLVAVAERAQSEPAQ